MLPNKTFRPNGGHILDIDGAEIGDQFLSLARNVHFRRGFPSRINGRRQAYATLSAGMNDPYHLLNFKLNTFNWWLSFGVNTIYAMESTNSYNVSIASQIAVNDPREWQSTLLNGIPVFTNGKNAPAYWNGNGASVAAALPAFPASTICRGICAFRFHIFAYNINEPAGDFDNKVIHSDATQPGALPASWTPSASNEAGSFILAETPGAIVVGLPLNTQLMLYKNNAIHAVEYAGQQPTNIFVQRPVVRTLGVLGPQCVREISKVGSTFHTILGNDDIALFDGVTLKSIADLRIKQSLANSIDEINGGNAFIVRDQNKRESWFCVPESGSQFATIAHVWDEARDTWTTRDLNSTRYASVGYVTDLSVSSTWNSDSNTWDSDNSAWDAPSAGAITRIATAESSKLYLEDTADATAVTAKIAKYDMLLDDDDSNKLITRVWLQGSGAGFAALQFRVGSRQSMDQNIAWQAFQTHQGGDGTALIAEVSGRYISIEIQSTGTDVWTLDRFKLEYRLNGAY